MANFVNMTPHPINLNDGQVFEPCGKVLHVPTVYNAPEDGIVGNMEVDAGNLELPEQVEGTIYIVSLITAYAIKQVCPERNDFVVPATGHPDCVRNEKGFIQSVPFLSRV